MSMPVLHIDLKMHRRIESCCKDRRRLTLLQDELKEDNQATVILSIGRYIIIIRLQRSQKKRAAIALDPILIDLN